MLEHWCQIISQCSNIGTNQGLQIASQIWWYPLFSLGPIQGHNVQHLLVTWGRLKSFFSISTFTPGVEPPVLISTFAPIGMLDLGWTLALTPSVKWALWSCHTLEVSQSNFRVIDSKVIVPATHREVPTSKSYMIPCGDADCARGGKSKSANSLLTYKSTKSEEFSKNAKGDYLQ
jgi:hypothetical protein